MSHLFCVGTELEFHADSRSLREGHITVFFFLTTPFIFCVWISYVADAETLPSLSVAAFEFSAVISYLSTMSEGIFWMEICFCWINNLILHAFPCSPLLLRQGKQTKTPKNSILRAWFALGSEKKQWCSLDVSQQEAVGLIAAALWVCDWQSLATYPRCCHSAPLVDGPDRDEALFAVLTSSSCCNSLASKKPPELLGRGDITRCYDVVPFSFTFFFSLQPEPQHTEACNWVDKEMYSWGGTWTFIAVLCSSMMLIPCSS